MTRGRRGSMVHEALSEQRECSRAARLRSRSSSRLDPRIRDVRAGGAHMGPQAFGTLAVIFNAMSFLAVVAPCGQETLIVRSWDEYGHRPAGAGARGAGVRREGHGAAPGWRSRSSRWSWPPGSRADRPLMLAACAFLLCRHPELQRPVFARGGRRRHRRGAARDPVAAAGRPRHPRASGAATPFTTVEFFVRAAGRDPCGDRAAADPGRARAAAGVKQAKPEYDSGGWLPRSFRMWLSAILDTTSQYLEVVAIGLFLGPNGRGVYFVATRITNVFAMISGSISTMRPRRSARCSTATPRTSFRRSCAPSRSSARS